MKKIISYVSMLFLLSAMIMIGIVNVLGALQLGKALQTANMASFITTDSLSPEASKALYSEVKVFQCQMKLDKDSFFLKYTLGSKMNSAEELLTKIVNSSFSEVDSNLGGTFLCPNV